MMTFLILSLAHLLLRTLAAREIARPFSDLVRVAHTLSFSCDGEGVGKVESREKGTGVPHCSSVPILGGLRP